MRFWTWKFIVSLAVTTLFLLVALPIAPDSKTGELRPLLPKLTGSGIASFVFLLAVLMVISHMGGWVLAWFRRRGKEEPEEPVKGKRKPRKK